MIRRSTRTARSAAEQLARKRERVRLTEPGRISHVKGFDTLPDGLRTLVEASFALNDRIVRLDLAMQVQTAGVQTGGELDAVGAGTPVAGASPVQAQVARLERAFSGRPLLRAVQTGS